MNWSYATTLAVWLAAGLSATSTLSAPVAQTNVPPKAPLPTGPESGDECPANSGAYCDDTAPVCCYVSGEWSCFKQLSDCTESSH